MKLPFVFSDLILKVFIQFLCTSLLIKSLSRELFSDISFTILIFSYFSIIINSTFDSLINKHLPTGYGDFFYKNSLVFKMAGYVPISILIFIFIPNISIWIKLPILLAGVVGILVDHQDIKLRYMVEYSPYKLRLYFTMLTSPIKLVLCFYGYYICFLFVGIVELIIVFFVNSGYVKISFRLKQYEINRFIEREWPNFSKTLLSGITIFTFFRLDQFFVYGVLGKVDYAYYTLAVRFNELINTTVGVVSRYYLPKLYSEENQYSYVLKKLTVFHISIGFILGILLYTYLVFWVPDYRESMLIYLILCFSGLPLIFGQLRGVFFIKKHLIMPDVYNAIIGIGAFWIFLGSSHSIQASNVAISYLVGFVFSGILTTFMYKDGRKFIKILRNK